MNVGSNSPIILTDAEALVIDSEITPAAARALVAAGADVLSIAPTHHSLEDVYLALVGGEDAEAGG
jgi:ABC-2 type transport system ATP-binding protein